MILPSFISVVIFILSTASFSHCSVDDFRRLSEDENAKLQIECGTLQNDKSNFRIPFGERAKRGQFPWAVMILTARGYLCTGSIISPYHVLTAAHCFVNNESGIINEDVSKFRILAGSVCFPLQHPTFRFTNCSIDGEPNEPIPWIILVKRMIIPLESLMFNTKNFGRIHRKNVTLDPKLEEMLRNVTPKMFVSDFGKINKNYNDIAVLELQMPLPPESFSMVPCIPSPNIRIPETVQIYGYGLTEDYVLKSGTRNSRLYYLDQHNIWSLTSCFKQEYGEICDRALFSFPERGDKRTVCPGDSGGGMTGKVGDKKFIFGVTSLAINYCDLPGSPFFVSVFCRLTFDLDFICYYTGICPNGYNKYMDKNYENHPQPVAYMSNGQGPAFIGPDNVVVPSKSKNIFTIISVKISVTVIWIIKKLF